MSNKRNPDTDLNQPMDYQIRIKGHLGRQWTDWFEGLSITLSDNGETVLTGPVIDQAALHGVLRKVRDLGLPLLATRTRPSCVHSKLPTTEERGAEQWPTDHARIKEAL